VTVDRRANLGAREVLKKEAAPDCSRAALMIESLFADL
jgi:hypothetical protein